MAKSPMKRCVPVPGLIAAALAAMLVCAACANRSGVRAGQEAAPEKAPPPLMPAADANCIQPPPAAQPPPMMAIPLTSPQAGQPIEPKRWPESKDPPATKPAKALVQNIQGAGRLVAGGQCSGYRFVFEDTPRDDGLEEAQVLPGKILETMAQALADNDGKQLLFHITAEVTRYKQGQFLLIRGAAYEVVAKARTEDRP